MLHMQAFRIPLGAVGHYIVAKFSPMTPDGEAGEPAYVISEKTVESMYTFSSYYNFETTTSTIVDLVNDRVQRTV